MIPEFLQGCCSALVPALSLLLSPGIDVQPETPAVPAGLECLIDAYPDFLDRAVHDEERGWMLLWLDGTRMQWDDGKADKTFEEKLNSPDLEDQMSISYLPGKDYPHPGVNDDPGRIRYEPFFKKMYGDSAQAVRARLVRVIWLPEKVNRRLKATKVNRVDRALSAVSGEFDKLPSKTRKYVEETSGPFNWRTIKGTNRLSSHSFGSAIDVGVKYSNYWKWSKPGADGKYEYKNRFPLEVVEIFEKHGFIWGGKWYHYDTMHFEYRPELLDARCVRTPKT